MVANTTTITVAPESAKRLRTIAELRGYDTVASYIDFVVKVELKNLGLDHEPPPGWEISVCAGDAPTYVAFCGPGMPLASLTPDQAERLAVAMRDLVAGRSKRGTIKATGDDSVQFVEIDRRGKGYRLTITDNITDPSPLAYTWQGLTTGLMLEIADHMDRVAGEARQ